MNGPTYGYDADQVRRMVIVLLAVRNNPGKDGVALRDHIPSQYLMYLREAEFKGLLTYAHNVWSLTAMGDLFLTENAE